MKTVTGIEAQKKRGEKVNLFLDGTFAFSLNAATVAEAGLHQGQKLSLADIEKLKEADLLHCSLNRALRFLSQRPRSEAEVRARLRRYGYDADTIGQVLSKLKEQKLVDDAAFARFWRENRENFRPRGRRLMDLELRQKGVDAETIAEVMEGVDDELSAYRAARRKVRSLSGLDYPSFRKHLGAFLRQRGFAYEVINRIIKQVWEEQGKLQTSL
jgi:regulatory protein